jgi:dTDP-4-amino-4,6-dideoxygalactose transaminase
VGAWLIEDIAQSFGARRPDGRPLGSAADFALASFGPGKPISAGGGGALFANTDEAAAVADAAWNGLKADGLAASAAGWARACALDLTFRRGTWWALTQLGLDQLGNAETSWGFRTRGLTASQAALARDGLRRLDQLIAARLRNAQFLLHRLAAHPTLKVVGYDPAYGQPSFLRLPVLASSPAERERALHALQAAGVGAGRLYPRSLPELFKDVRGSYPGAACTAASILTLPTHPRLREDDLARMAAVLDQLAM